MRFVAVAVVVVSLGVCCGGGGAVEADIWSVRAESSEDSVVTLSPRNGCGRNPRVVRVEEAFDEVRVKVHIDPLFSEYQLLCEEVVRLELAEPIGDRVVLDLSNGRTHYPQFWD